MEWDFKYIFITDSSYQIKNMKYIKSNVLLVGFIFWHSYCLRYNVTDKSLLFLQTVTKVLLWYLKVALYMNTSFRISKLYDIYASLLNVHISLCNTKFHAVPLCFHCKTVWIKYIAKYSIISKISFLLKKYSCKVISTVLHKTFFKMRTSKKWHNFSGSSLK